jgi:hypothetical protein
MTMEIEQEPSACYVVTSAIVKESIGLDKKIRDNIKLLRGSVLFEEGLLGDPMGEPVPKQLLLR